MFKTLRDAIILVAVVVLLFLQNWRSALIPLVAVPVAIVGTFAVMAAMGFSLNNLTLFGLVLAIGIVVDDAIVVVEAVEHHVEHGMAPREATIRAMDEVSGPVIAIGLVLDGGVRALRVHLGHRRAVLPPVRPDDRDVHGDLGVQLADPQPRPGGHAHPAQGPGKQVALPRLAYVALGGFLGLPSWPPARRPGGCRPEWLAPTIAAVAGAGGLAAGLADRPAAGLVLRGVQRRFRLATRGYTGSWGDDPPERDRPDRSTGACFT